MIRSSTAVLAASLALLVAATLAAQEPKAQARQPNAADTQAKAGGKRLVSIRADAVQELRQLWPNTRLGKLLADEDVVDAATKTLNYTKNHLVRQAAVLQAFTKHDMLDGMDSWEIASLYTSGNGDVWQMFRFPIEEVQHAEMTIATPPEAKFMQPTFVTSLWCGPRYEGRWTQAFEQEAKHMRDSPIFKEVIGTKIDGFPAYAFTPPESFQDNDYFNASSVSRWMLHMPGRFVYGTGNTQDLAIPSEQPAKQTPEISMELHFENYLAMFNRMAGGMGAPAPLELAILGIDSLKTLKWSGQFVGELIQDELSVDFHNDPTGVAGVLLAGKAKLPAQALPKGAIAQLRAAINMDRLLKLLVTVTNDFELPKDLTKQLARAFDGGLALSCCAPAPGGVIPRLYASCTVKDEKALDAVLAQYVTENLPTKKVTYSGVECTVLKIPDMPNGIQPAFCRVNGTLHIAESALSLRAFLKVQGEDTVAMDVEDAPEPGGAGDLVSTFDWRFDEVQLYKCFYQDWLPLYELTGMANDSPVRRKDMPEPDVVEMYCGKSRGVLRKDGNKFSIVMLGALGGPELAALAMTWGPMIAGQMRDYQTDNLTIRLARHKLDTVHEAVVAFHKREKRMPKDLAELFTAQKLNDDALLLPGDDLAEEFAMPDGRKLKSSFRYFAKPVTFASQNGDGGDTILIEIRTRPYNRLSMTSMGVVPDAYGPDSQKPIDQFGKGGSGTSSAGESTGRASTGGHNHK